MLETLPVKAAEALSTWVLGELERRAWSQRELARRAGWSAPAALSKLLKGQQRYSLDDLERIARGFDLPLATMLSLAADGEDANRRPRRVLVEPSSNARRALVEWIDALIGTRAPSST